MCHSTLACQAARFCTTRFRAAERRWRLGASQMTYSSNAAMSTHAQSSIHGDAVGDFLRKRPLLPDIAGNSTRLTRLAYTPILRAEAE